jgi:hypothetical protein
MMGRADISPKYAAKPAFGYQLIEHGQHRYVQGHTGAEVRSSTITVTAAIMTH